MKTKDDEHRLQCACVMWFRVVFPALSRRLVAIPNGGRRDAVTGARLKAEGVVAGVADLVLFVPRGSYGALCLEMKTKAGRQSQAQKEWAAALGDDYKYCVCHSFEEFRTAINNYLKQ